MKLGVDCANSSSKVVTGQGLDQRAVYPNGLRSYVDGEFNLLGKDVAQNIYEFDGEKYIEHPNGISSTSRNSAKYKQKIYYMETMIAISKKIKNGSKISLVVGLPCEDHKEEEIITYLTKLFKGTHAFKINDDLFAFEVIELEILAQPMGTLTHYLVSEDLIPNEELLEQNILTVDIGYGTLDLTESIGFNIKNHESTDIGCMDIANLYLDSIKKAYPKCKFKREDIGYELKTNIKKMNQVYDCTGYLEQAKKVVAERICSFIVNSGYDFTSYDAIIFTGGGSIQLKEQLDKFVDTDTKVFIANPVIANAIGFWKYAELTM